MRLLKFGSWAGEMQENIHWQEKRPEVVCIPNNAFSIITSVVISCTQVFNIMRYHQFKC